jgi:predicted kinase
MKIMVIMQGHSGSGKSTLAKHIANVLDAEICSADNFFMNGDKYEFDARFLRHAHTSCKIAVGLCIKNQKNVVVDNTNTRNWEAAEYVKAGVNAGYTIKFVRATGNFPNIHGVPDNVVQAMKDRMEDLSVEECLKY